MRHCSIYNQLLLTLALVSSSCLATTTNTARLHLYDQNILVESGEAKVLGQVIAKLSFSSIVEFENPNGEFVYAEQPPNGWVHSSVLLLEDPTIPGAPGLLGLMVIQLPEDQDLDADGIPDFYQVTNAISAVTSMGYFQLEEDFDSGSVRIQWNRGAGQHRGSCSITLTGENYLTTPLAFTHPFEILEYSGTYSYLPSTNRVTGEVQLVQLGNPNRRFDGPLTMALLPEPNSTDGTDFLPSVWTNAAGREAALDFGYLDRAPEFPVEYFGELFWSDLDPSSSDLFGFGSFLIGIDDPNDHDADGIPDLTDPPRTVPGPRLTLRPATVGFALEIEGTENQTLQVQTASGLSDASEWTPVFSVTLTNSTQTFQLPASAATTAFWRVLVAPL